MVRNLLSSSVTDKGEWLDVPDSALNLAEREGALNFQFNPEQLAHIFRFYTPQRLRAGR